MRWHEVAKNDSVQSKIIPFLMKLNLPRFFSYRIGGEKARQIQNWNFLVDLME